MTRIQGSNDTALQAAQTDRTQVANAKSASGSAPAKAAAERVSTANFSVAASALAAAASTSGDVRADKIEALKAAIASGTYKVPAEKVADKLIDHMLG